MHYTGTPLWPFGFGLAYTNWSATLGDTALTMTTAALAADYGVYYSLLPHDAPPPTMSRQLAVTVENVGTRASAVVVQVFATATATAAAAGAAAPPLRQLAGFGRAARVEAGVPRAAWDWDLVRVWQ